MARSTSDHEATVDVSEATPLLENNTGPSDVYSRKGLFVIFICLSLIVSIDIGAGLQLAPSNKILEGIICKNYFPDFADVDDQRCKNNDVQGTLAVLRGWQFVTQIIPGLLTTLIYGFLADKYGRRIILFISIVGIILNYAAFAVICWFSDIFSVWLTLATPLVMMMGGGSVVAASLVFTIVADVAPESQRATTLFILGAGTLVGDLVAAPMSSILMERNVWIPIMLGILIMIISTLGIFVLPETLNFKTLGRIPEDLETTHSTTKDNSESTLLSRIKTEGSQLVTAVRLYIWGNTNVALLMLTLIFTSLGNYARELLLQYSTKKFNWTWAQAGYLLSLRAICSLVLLSVIVPVAGQILISKYSLTAKAKDFWIARTSILMGVFGAFIIAFSASSPFLILGVIVLSAGGVYNLATHSLMASMVEPHHIGILFNCSALLQTLGSILAGPLLASSFSLGLRMGGIWTSLPFLIAGCLFSCGAIIAWSIDIAVKKEEIGEEDMASNM
ncbi:hypothetical protein BP6252_10980 [Coleophoma cylindrospora]|uniref:Major facilitator superfamily (MFS) profile domain-containing protein n=1 Tax=Coleophoma cylindrospora TaxID=1849047 RepID=A0A3D8QNQ2_9HELO|nr:hypothetical protein BP6252_10980 [Coleophoma cylindrospora]